jgi:hypothetical protein
VINTAMLVCVWGCVGWLLFRAIPDFAEIRLIDKAAQLQSQLLGEVMRGRLPHDDDAVRKLLIVTRGLAAEPQQFGLTEALAVHAAYVRLQVPLPTSINFTALPNGQKQALKEVEAGLERALREYLILGSRFWFLLVPLLAASQVFFKLCRSLRVSRPVPTVLKRAGFPEQLAREVALAALARA